MNDKIEVGEYVRSNLGTIGKITKIEDSKFLYENKCLICFISNVVKHSKNIIDLIEEGDYVNGCKVACVKYDDILETKRVYLYNENSFYDYEIKSVVTKEQFSSIEYKV